MPKKDSWIYLGSILIKLDDSPAFVVSLTMDHIMDFGPETPETKSMVWMVKPQKLLFFDFSIGCFSLIHFFFSWAAFPARLFSIVKCTKGSKSTALIFNSYHGSELRAVVKEEFKDFSGPYIVISWTSAMCLIWIAFSIMI